MKKEKVKAMKIKSNSRFFDVLIYGVLILCAAFTTLPMLYVLSASFASGAEIAAKGLVLFPSEPTLDAYRYIFSTPTLTNSLKISILVTVVGTIINIVLSSMTAYALSDITLPGRKLFMVLITFTMLFNAGMVPGFLLVKQLHLYNSLWALILPSAINTWNLIVMKNFFQQLPKEMLESAAIDGCSEMRTLFKIVVPLSAPVIATFTLFYAVGNWNTFTAAILYLNDMSKMPVQVTLRQVVMMSQMIGNNEVAGAVAVPTEAVKMASIIISTVPILIVYPFLQKHFAKGVMVGSIKG